MHLGRFHEAVRELSVYFAGLEFDRHINKAISYIQTYNSNKAPAQLTAFRERLHELANKAEATPSSFLLPSVLALHQDLHVEDFVGSRLAARIHAAMDTPGMIVEEVVTELTALHAQVTNVIAQINSLENLLRERGVEVVKLEGSEAEFGIAFPPELVGTTAKDLISEVAHLNRLFMSMNELLGRGTESPEVRTIAASWWQFFFELDGAQVAFWSVALERIIHLIKTGYEIRRLKQDLEEKKGLVPENFIPELEAKLLQTYKDGVADLAKEMREKSGYQGDKGRANELEISLKQELLHLLRRVNGGAVLEVRLAEPEAPEVAEEEVEAGSPEAALRAERVARIEEVGQMNEKLAHLSHVTALLEIREDLLLDAPAEEAKH
jgi:hypothetical protein